MDRLVGGQFVDMAGVEKRDMKRERTKKEIACICLPICLFVLCHDVWACWYKKEPLGLDRSILVKAGQLQSERDDG